MIVRKFIGSKKWGLVRRKMGGLLDWRPQPPCRPRVNPDFCRMSRFSRVVESLRYNFASWEYWVSPGGVLREFIRKSLGVAAVAGSVWLIVRFLSCLEAEINSFFYWLLPGVILLLAAALLYRFLPRLFRFARRSRDCSERKISHP